MYLHFFRLMCRRDIVELQALMVNYVMGAVKQLKATCD